MMTDEDGERSSETAKLETDFSVCLVSQKIKSKADDIHTFKSTNNMEIPNTQEFTIRFRNVSIDLML